VPANVTILRRCRCVNYLLWPRAPYGQCRHGIIRNSVEKVDYPPEAWHYCALYGGPMLSRDVFVCPRDA
jgi:hypothetical protein